MNSLTKDQTVLKRTLLTAEMHRLEIALGRDDEPDYVAHVERRLGFILSRLDRLPEDHQQDIIDALKEQIESNCTDEALRSRLFAILDRALAA